MSTEPTAPPSPPAGADASALGPHDAPDARALTTDFSRRQRAVLLGSVFLVASCGLAYELIAGAVSTYLLGDGVLQFSLVIGIFLSAMGIGSFLSRYVRKNLLRTFFAMEVLIGITGAAMAPMLLWTYVSGAPYVPVLLAMLGLVGILSGMEIPLLLRLFERHESLRLSASAVLGLDYVGALFASLLTPILVVPYIGTVGASALFGLLNLLVAVIGLMAFPSIFRTVAGRRAATAGLLALTIPLGFVVAYQDTISKKLEANLYQDPVVYAQNTQFQRIVLTRWRGDLRLFLNGSLQFASKDEYRYHEALVHPAMAASERRARVLVLGGGDGCAVREILKWPEVETVDLVDLDPRMTALAKNHPDLVRVNEGSFLDPRVTVHNTDALRFFTDGEHAPWDVIIMDLPDPSTTSLSRLYAKSTFRLVGKHLHPDGVMVSQSTSPFFARTAFWCIVDTLEGTVAGGPGGPELTVSPYRVTVPSFGLWGYSLATRQPIDPTTLSVDVPTRHVTTELMPTLFAFPPDEGRPSGERCVNRLNDPVLARVYREGWKRYGE